MPTFENPAADADEVQEALRGLAHATRSIDDPRQICSVLGSLTSAVASLSRSLHQIATFHDKPPEFGDWAPVLGVRSQPHRGHEVAWELHRAAEMLRQISVTISNAHTAESQISYAPRAADPTARPSHASTERGLGL